MNAEMYTFISIHFISFQSWDRTRASRSNILSEDIKMEHSIWIWRYYLKIEYLICRSNVQFHLQIKHSISGIAIHYADRILFVWCSFLKLKNNKFISFDGFRLVKKIKKCRLWALSFVQRRVDQKSGVRKNTRLNLNGHLGSRWSNEPPNLVRVVPMIVYWNHNLFEA